jgi:hypothetical protein
MNDFGVVVVGTALGTIIGVAFTAAIGATLFWFKWPCFGSNGRFTG